MADYRATIRTVSDEAADPGDGLVVEHHRTPRAVLEVGLWSGGHLLHLAVAGCLFNDLLREAPNRGITVDHLSVTADGDFDASGSSGIRYAIEIRSSADRPAVERLVRTSRRAPSFPRGCGPVSRWMRWRSESLPARAPPPSPTGGMRT